ncbi:hypothetical protein [Streptomyces chrestomyceticus]|uniref:hypothetical protein n=1 Tax=Streptomyces chrestomyceticus TaxID=68185 RepID=UPI0033CD7F3B
MHGILPLIVLTVTVCTWLWKRRRTSKLATAAGTDLLPPNRQDTERPCADPEADAVTEALVRGEWQTAAKVISAAGTDWEHRSHLVGVVAERAAEDDTWLRAWEAARPDDPDAAVVRASAQVTLAWEIRGAYTAEHTTAEQFAGFHRVLREAREAFERAEALALPGDPTPYVKKIPLYMGLGASHAMMLDLWSEVTSRAPHHFEGHVRALQYWCAKWRGSAEIARDFAGQAAATAPPGSLLTVLRLIAWFEHEDETPSEAYGWPDVLGMTDDALRDVGAARPDDRRVAEVRHLLAYFLTKQDRHEAALEQFRAVDGYVGALPWSYRPSPAKTYCRYRTKALRGAVSGS